MAEIMVLDVLLHQQSIGKLTRFPGDKTLFSFNQDYIENQDRPVLSLSFKDTLGELITEIKPTQTRVPPFFSNLLPEGPMREYLAERAGVHPQREFFLLRALGQDLPGALEVRPEDLQEKMETLSKGDSEKMMRFSLAGVQLKFSAVLESSGGLTIPASGVGGHWIVKLPSSKYNGVPENEYAMMELARRLGMDVPETKLMPIEKIAGLPKEMAPMGPYAFAIKRFDRQKDRQAVHMEDFAQIFARYPEQKYQSASYRNIAEVIRVEVGEEGVAEFIRRFVFNALIGNGDMHLKNWSLIYPDRRSASLAPAYDFVSTIQYIPEDRLALNFVDSKSFEAFNLDRFARFAAKARLSEKLVLETVRDTVGRFENAWHSSDLVLNKQARKIIEAHLKTMPIYSNPTK